MVLSTLTNCKVVSTIKQEDDLDGWLEARSHGIGGSDIGAICGVSKYSTPRLTYLEKTGQWKEEFTEEALERMEWGHILEPVVADRYALKTGKRVVVSPATLAFVAHPWAQANLDRFIVDDDGVPYGVLECKTANARMAEDWENGDIPLYYYYQLQWYMMVTGLRYGVIACLVGGQRFYMHEVFYNEELMSEVFELASKFWNYNVKNLIEPDITGIEADSEYLKETFLNVVPKSEITLEGELINDVATQFLESKARLKELEKYTDELGNKLRERLVEHEIGYTSDYVIKWSKRTANRVDSDRLKTQFPDVYSKCIKTSEYRVLTVK